MSTVNGQITARLRTQIAADDPAWSPDREASTPPVTRQPSEGWPITGRRLTAAARAAEQPHEPHRLEWRPATPAEDQAWQHARLRWAMDHAQP